MLVNKTTLSQMFQSAAKMLHDNIDKLSEIDARFGDGDHGITIEKISKAIEKSLTEWQNESIKDFLDTLGVTILGINGGSAGPLYGTLIAGFGSQLQDDEHELDSEGVVRMFKGALAEMQDITTAKVGDKTMMDALIPAVDAVINGKGEPEQLFQLAAIAAEQGAKDSEQYVSKFGRAKSYKEQTLGTPDAGAVSTSYLFRGLANGINMHS